MVNIVNKQEIFDILKNTPGVRATSDIQLITRCFLCGDSAKNKNKKRLGIKIDVNNPSEPILYHCFNCNSYGVLTPEMVNQMGIYNRDLSASIMKLNSQALKDDGTKVNKYKNNKEIQVKFPPLYKTERTIQKIKYIYNRIGYKIPIKDFDSLKIVFNLDEFLICNNIPIIRPDQVKIISDYYVGFLSINNEYIIFRDITNQQQMRYIKFNIFNVKDNTNSFYSMRTSVDIIDTEPIHLCIAEGTFDALGIRYNILNNEMHNTIIMAACNGSFRNPLNYFIHKGLIGENIYIDCYQDNDTKLNFKKLRSEFTPYLCSRNQNFKVFYNTLRKDFGYPKEEIQIDELII